MFEDNQISGNFTNHSLAIAMAMATLFDAGVQEAIIQKSSGTSLLKAFKNSQ